MGPRGKTNHWHCGIETTQLGSGFWIVILTIMLSWVIGLMPKLSAGAAGKKDRLPRES